ncbi:hypothetical protein [Streptomyces sp. NPDC020747]|uniref:hypothetical protein n=1 Tax=Streptomyces sp. NPDC020747 TaxID=3365086 RepID=UPI0037A7F07F
MPNTSRVVPTVEKAAMTIPAVAARPRAMLVVPTRSVEPVPAMRRSRSVATTSQRG